MSSKNITKYKRMFGCDTARISKPLGSGNMYLIIGYKRNTKDTAGQWYKNGEPIDFDFVEQKVVASGANEDELLEDAKRYKKLLRK